MNCEKCGFNLGKVNLFNKIKCPKCGYERNLYILLNSIIFQVHKHDYRTRTN